LPLGVFYGGGDLKLADLLRRPIDLALNAAHLQALGQALSAPAERWTSPCGAEGHAVLSHEASFREALLLDLYLLAPDANAGSLLYALVACVADCQGHLKGTGSCRLPAQPPCITLQAQPLGQARRRPLIRGSTTLGDEEQVIICIEIASG